MEFTKNELAVKEMRSEGMSFREIGKELGLSTERARQINLKYYKKRAVDADITKNWGLLKRECKTMGISDAHLVRMTRILKRNGFSSIHDPRLTDAQLVSEIYGMGDIYTEAITSAAHKWVLQNRR